MIIALLKKKKKGMRAFSILRVNLKEMPSAMEEKGLELKAGELPQKKKTWSLATLLILGIV